MATIDHQNATGLEAGDLHATQMRKRSIGSVELTDKSGRRRTVQLDELTDADRALAEKFGYKPVSREQPYSLMATASVQSN